MTHRIRYSQIQLYFQFRDQYHQYYHNLLEDLHRDNTLRLLGKIYFYSQELSTKSFSHALILNQLLKELSSSSLHLKVVTKKFN